MKIFKVSKDKEKNNPWAICNTTVDKDKDPEKYERCVQKVKKQNKKKKEKVKKKKSCSICNIRSSECI